MNVTTSEKSDIYYKIQVALQYASTYYPIDPQVVVDYSGFRFDKDFNDVFYDRFASKYQELTGSSEIIYDLYSQIFLNDRRKVESIKEKINSLVINKLSSEFVNLKLTTTNKSIFDSDMTISFDIPENLKPKVQEYNNLVQEYNELYNKLFFCLRNNKNSESYVALTVNNAIEYDAIRQKFDEVVNKLKTKIIKKEVENFKINTNQRIKKYIQDSIINDFKSFGISL